MPELPEVETVVRGLTQRLTGRRFARIDLHRADLRGPLPPGLKAKLEGRRIERIDRRGKYILVHCDDGGVMLAHLGMSGRMVLHEAGAGDDDGRGDKANKRWPVDARSLPALSSVAPGLT